MSDEIERARAVLSASHHGAPRPWRAVRAPGRDAWGIAHKNGWMIRPESGAFTAGQRYYGSGLADYSDEARANAIALLGSCWPELLAVVEAADGYVADPEIADAGPLAEWDAMCAALDALRARLREHLGGDDG